MNPISFKGSPGSPYTRKMLGVLRYRHIPYRMLIGTRDSDFGLPVPRVKLLPTFYLENEEGRLEAVTDSTPLIRRLEVEVEGRPVIPRSPVLRFLDELIEDYADEWLTKAMFHYRWHYSEDARKAGGILPHWANISAPDKEIQKRQEEFSRRQISRLYVVGSNSVTAPVIEGSYRRFLRILEDILCQQPFILGHRPSSCDFAVYGQLTQLAHFDPTPSAIALQEAPRVYAWIDLIDDLSGLDPADSGWMVPGDAKKVLSNLLQEIGRTYCPVMLADIEALDSGADTVDTHVDGAHWQQTPFPYHRKCVLWLRESHAALDAPSRTSVDDLLEGTGCDALMAGR